MEIGKFLEALEEATVKTQLVIEKGVLEQLKMEDDEEGARPGIMLTQARIKAMEDRLKVMEITKKF